MQFVLLQGEQFMNVTNSARGLLFHSVKIQVVFTATSYVMFKDARNGH